MIIAIMFVLTSQAQAQKKNTTTGNWFFYSVESHDITVAEGLFVFDTIISGKIDSNKWYTLPCGVKIIISHPSEYLEVLEKSYGTYNLEDLRDSIKASKETVWDASMPHTKNSYFHLSSKTTKYVMDYSGAVQGYKVIALSGKAKIKRSCGNVQLPMPVVNTTVVKTTNSNTTDNTNNNAQGNGYSDGNDYNYNGNGPKKLNQNKGTITGNQIYYYSGQINAPVVIFYPR